MVSEILQKQKLHKTYQYSHFYDVKHLMIYFIFQKIWLYMTKQKSLS